MIYDDPIINYQGMVETPYIKRFQQEKVQRFFQHFSVTVVSGARQVGKSTLLEHTFPDIPRVVFDPIIDIEQARQDPDFFLQQRKPPIILDEIQYVPTLVPAIKRRLEKGKKPGQYILTGSQQWEVMKLLAESLAGRAAFIDMDAFSIGEVCGIAKENLWLEAWLSDPRSVIHSQHSLIPLKRPLLEQLWRGFFPEIQFLPDDLVTEYFASYHRTYVERDIRQMGNISDLHLFGRFFKLCAALTAQEINHSQIGRELGVTPQTASRWLSLMKATFLWSEIPSYSRNSIKKLSEKPKGYLLDTGLSCWSLGIISPEVIISHPHWGALFESMMVTEILKQCHFMKTPPNIYHWRSHGGAEVDLVLEWNNTLYPIEIKGKSHPDRHDVRGIQAFRSTYPKKKVAPGLIMAPTESFHALTESDYVMPWNFKM